MWRIISHIVQTTSMLRNGLLNVNVIRENIIYVPFHLLSAFLRTLILCGIEERGIRKRCVCDL